MRDRIIFALQLLFTLIVAAFLAVPAALSIAAGVTVNYFRGIQSGVTLQWVAQVLDLYAGTIMASIAIALGTTVWMVRLPTRPRGGHARSSNAQPE